MSAPTAREKIAIGLLAAEYLIPPFVPLVKIWTGEPHLDTGPDYPTLAFMSVAMIAMWPCCLVASIVSKERRWYYIAATLLFPFYFEGVMSLQPLLGVRP